MINIKFNYKDNYNEIVQEKFDFYEIPKFLFENNKFKKLSCKSKVCYGILTDVMNIPISDLLEKNVTVIFKNRDMAKKEIAKLTNCRKKEIIKIIDELKLYNFIIYE